ncbi:MAG: Flp pilus assembly protein CpaB [Verrucomicrobiota bacterium]
MAGIGKAFNILFVVAIVIGGLCIFLLFQYINNVKEESRKAALKEAGSSKIELVKVLTANVDIEHGTLVEESMTKMAEVPKEYVPETALTSADKLGRRLAAHFIPQGDLILDAKLKEREQIQRASLKITPGMRLVTTSVNDTKATAFLIKNGDYVDLIGTFTIADAGRTALNRVTDTAVTFTFLQHVKVYDIIYGNPAPPPTNNKNKSQVDPRVARGTTVTFEVTPQIAERILAAESRASGITMVLRRYDDEEKVTGLGTNVETVLEEYLPPQPIIEESEEVLPPPPPTPTRKTVF